MQSCEISVIIEMNICEGLTGSDVSLGRVLIGGFEGLLLAEMLPGNIIFGRFSLERPLISELLVCVDGKQKEVSILPHFFDLSERTDRLDNRVLAVGFGLLIEHFDDRAWAVLLAEGIGHIPHRVSIDRLVLRENQLRKQSTRRVVAKTKLVHKIVYDGSFSRSSRTCDSDDFHGFIS